uniref:Uncharacterized protein n=3 Tax=Triticinae TaxID=1648030 RepID=A0A453Q4A2_AEGTS
TPGCGRRGAYCGKVGRGGGRNPLPGSARVSSASVFRRRTDATMSKKNSLSKRKKQHEFDLQREKKAKEEQAKKLQAKKSKMKIDGSEKKKKGSSFKVGKKKVKTKLSALGKAKAAQAMELDN